MRLLIARNGEMQKPGGILTEAGVRQVRKLAASIKDDNLEAIFSSNLPLEQETAGRIGLYHDNVFVMGRDYLSAKRDMGEEELMEEARAVIEGARNYRSALIVTEGKQYHALTASILGISYQDAQEMGEIKPTALTVFDPFPEMKTYASLAHLNGSK